MSTKITEDVRARLLRRPLKPSVTRDRDVPGLCLHVTTRRSFWALSYQPRGVNPATGKRWGGGVRHELGDAWLVGVQEARALALAAKALVRQGRSPHHEQMALRTSVEAARSIVLTTVAQALDAYAKAIEVRSRASTRTRRQILHYARTAVTIMSAAALPLRAIDVRLVRLMIETAPGGDFHRRHTFNGLARFLAWCLKQELIERNPCDGLEKSDRPPAGRARSHVPSIATLRAVWHAVEDEPDPARDLIRFLMLAPLRRNEASGLLWSEVSFSENRIRIAASRMKAREAHELPLSAPARATLEARKLTATSELVFPSSADLPYVGWGKILPRIRQAIGEGSTGRDDRFSLHDLRRAFVSHLAGAFDVDALDQCLAHKRGGVAAIYQRSRRWPERVKALDQWATLITGDEPAGVVVPFARRADG
jgi:integrase